MQNIILTNPEACLVHEISVEPDRTIIDEAGVRAVSDVRESQVIIVLVCADATPGHVVVAQRDARVVEATVVSKGELAVVVVGGHTVGVLADAVGVV